MAAEMQVRVRRSDNRTERFAAFHVIGGREPAVHLADRCRIVLSAAATALAATALSAAPASALTPAPVAGCPAVPTVQPFAPWQDVADYMLAPDGDFEAGASGWLLQGGARAAQGNEPFKVGRAADHTSLRLPAGSSATTAPMCIGVEHRTMRFFASAPQSGALAVTANFTQRNGKQKSVRLGVARGSDAWAPSDVLPMRVNEQAEQFDNALWVTLTFTPRSADAWLIDDVYIDPFRFK